MQPEQWTFLSQSPAETERLGGEISSALRPGDSIALHGEVGAGKTVFVRGILRGLGILDFEGSPTFLLVQRYITPRQGWEVLHVDAYRLGPNADEEWIRLGWYEWLDEGAILLAEWAEYLAVLLPPDRLEISMSHSEEEEEGAETRRVLRFFAREGRSKALLDAIRSQRARC